MRFVTPVVVIVVVAVAAGALYVSANKGTVQYRTAAAVLGTVTQTMPISGNLTAVNQTDLDFGASGKVQAVNVQAGQTVKAGDVLASLDPTSLLGTLTQAQANLASAQAKLSLDQAGPSAQNLAQAQASVTTAQVQLQNDLTSQADTAAVNQQMVAQAQNSYNAAYAAQSADCATNSSSNQCATDRQQVASAQSTLSAAPLKAQQSNDQAQALVNSAQAALQNAQAALAAVKQGTTAQQIQIDQSQVQVDQVNVDNAQRAVNQAALTAPVDGVVSQVSIAVGQTVSGSGSASSSSGGGAGASTTSSSSPSTSTHAVSILTPGAYAVTGAISDAQVGQIAIGQPARITPAGSTEALAGKVTQIAAVATVTSGVATFPVTVTIDGSNPSLHAGTSASIAIIVNQASQVLTVPTSALRGGSSVQVLVKGQAQTRPVQVGASDPLRTQILAGLNPGDQVITATVSSAVPATTRGGGLGGFGGGGRGGFGGGGGGRGGGG
jgi:multidrug efflux pump subunit AcrA (membrane-fusion protein)